MPTLDDPTSKSERIELLAAEYAHLAGAATPIAERMDAIKAELRLLLDFGSYPAAGLKIGIQPNNTFDPVAFATRYPRSHFPQFYKDVPDTKKIKHYLPEVEQRSFQKAGTPKVVIS